MIPDYTSNTKVPSAVLINLPWSILTEPSQSLGVLSACLKQEQIACRVMHLNLFLPQLLQDLSYESLSTIFALNDFLFSGVLDPVVSPEQEIWLRFKVEELIQKPLEGDEKNKKIEELAGKISHLRKTVIPSWLSEWANQIVTSEATLVYMTCQSDQTIASLALAQLIRQKSKVILIVLGGDAVRNPTGKALLESFPCIDAVCNDEEEPSILKLAKVSVGSIAWPEVPNLLYRDSENQIHATKRAHLMDVNKLPIPDFDDYFADLNTLPQANEIPIGDVRLPIENSRGCWWGQTRNCKLCGMIDEDLNDRYKDAANVIETMNSLSQRYHQYRFRFTDHTLPYNYFNTLLPQLIQMGSPYNITSEIRTTIRKNKFLLLTQAGFDEIKPGIHFIPGYKLPMLNKGATPIQTIYILLLGKRFGTNIHYNIQLGLPNENLSLAHKIIKLLPHLSHLDAPATKPIVHFTRYTLSKPDAEMYGIPPVQFEPSYRLIFSPEFLEKTRFDLHNFCHYFENPFQKDAKRTKILDQIETLIDDWKSAQTNHESTLRFRKKGKEIEITDTRKENVALTYTLNPTESYIYKKIIDPINIETLKQRCKSQIRKSNYEKAIRHFQELGLIIQDEGKILGLAIPDK